MTVRALKASIAALLLGLRFSPASAAIFNDVAPGARAMGMGAYSAVAEGLDALYHNPAGLAASDFMQAGGGVGRLVTPKGLLSFESMAYTRPLPVIPESTVGAAFYSLRQSGGGKKDSFLLHFSDRVRLPQLYLRGPVRVGGNLRFTSAGKEEGKSNFGLAVDGGAILEATDRLRFALALAELGTGLGVPNPTFTLGTAYRVLPRLSAAADMRVRPGLTEFYPGLEADFFQQLLKLRLGKGVPLDGGSQLAFGVGANFSPVVVDFAMSIPWGGLNRPGGGSQLTATYRFGAPAFYGRFIGTAARRAEDLRSEISELEERRKKLDVQVATAESDRSSIEGQSRALQERMKEMQEKLRETELRLERAQYELSHLKGQEAPKPKPEAPKPPAGPVFPRKRQVKPGETLRGIAKDEYGDAALWELLFEANPDKIERGMPVEGAVLAVPAPKKRD